MKIIAFVLMCLCPALAAAQGAVPIPERATEPEGLVPEPGLITRAVLFADRHLGKGDLNNGFHFDFGNMIPGAGWVSIGPGYRQWYGKDTMLLDDRAAEVREEPSRPRRASEVAGLPRDRLLRRRPRHARERPHR